MNPSCNYNNKYGHTDTNTFTGSIRTSETKGVIKWFSIKVPPGHFKHFRPRPSLLLWLQSGWILVMDQSSAESSTDRQAGWTLISPSMFDRAECKNNTNPSGPYGKFWEDQLLKAFKAIIFISHPQWVILISDEGLVVWWQEQDNEGENLPTCVHQRLDFSYPCHLNKSNAVY